MSRRPTDPDAPAWRLPPALTGAGAVHAAALATVLAAPTAWPWALGAVALSHGVITALTLRPRTQLLGPNLVRLPPHQCRHGEVAITLDDGPDPEVTPAVLDVLDAHAAKASFFCIGERVDRHPALAREIVRRGHTVENHSQRHRHHFALLGPKSYRAELNSSQQRIAAATGRAPSYFRAPAGFRNPFLWPQLGAAGLQLASWTRRGFDTRDGDAQRVLRRLTRGLAAGDILLLHDGHCARTPQGDPVVLQVLPALLDVLRSRGLRAVALPDAGAA
ncbi:bifunctional xylanase/deacetylase precursor [mine drainage metagenome]|jgi:peptidoglycan/xylan/chitin deacetylase (PgdA/CDA1 family)|uniref:Bifunctional xylanase/deacetylase n=1 Tax=mine drainage metagenome TaxID=410659 RepID=A0A1J5R1P0_9ZZZZ